MTRSIDPPMMYEAFLGHIMHMDDGVRYTRGCKVCELKAGPTYRANSDTKADTEYYREAQASGKRTSDI